MVVVLFCVVVFVLFLHRLEHSIRLLRSLKEFPKSFLVWVFCHCRVCGSYEAMGLGRISEALQDFTGGVIEMINLQAPPADGSLDVFKVLQKAHERNSLMGASIEVRVCVLIEFKPAKDVRL